MNLNEALKILKENGYDSDVPFKSTMDYVREVADANGITEEEAYKIVSDTIMNFYNYDTLTKKLGPATDFNF